MGAENIDDCIATFPDEVQPRLREVRRAIAEAAPQADEAISYRILIYFAGFKSHIALYPVQADMPGAGPGDRALRVKAKVRLATASSRSSPRRTVWSAAAAYGLKKFEQERSEIYNYDLAVSALHFDIAVPNVRTPRAGK